MVCKLFYSQVSTPKVDPNSAIFEACLHPSCSFSKLGLKTYLEVKKKGIVNISDGLKVFSAEISVLVMSTKTQIKHTTLKMELELKIVDLFWFKNF